MYGCDVPASVLVRSAPLPGSIPTWPPTASKETEEAERITRGGVLTQDVAGFRFARFVTAAVKMPRSPE